MEEGDGELGGRGREELGEVARPHLGQVEPLLHDVDIDSGCCVEALERDGKIALATKGGIGKEGKKMQAAAAALGIGPTCIQLDSTGGSVNAAPITIESRVSQSAYVRAGTGAGLIAPNMRAKARSLAMHVVVFTATVDTRTGIFGSTPLYSHSCAKIHIIFFFTNLIL